MQHIISLFIKLKYSLFYAHLMKFLSNIYAFNNEIVSQNK